MRYGVECVQAMGLLLLVGCGEDMSEVDVGCPIRPVQQRAALQAESCESRPGPCTEATAAGVARAPRPGDIIISEVLANPSGVDGGREWFEIRVGAAEAIALNGLRVVQKSSGKLDRFWNVDASSCMIGEPSTIHVLMVTPNDEPAKFNGMALPGNTVRNQESEFLLIYGDDVIDRAVVPAALSGKAWNLDEAVINDAQANDQPSNFCEARKLIDGDADLGTPGKPNDLCADVSSDVDVSREAVVSGESKSLPCSP